MLMRFFLFIIIFQFSCKIFSKDIEMSQEIITKINGIEICSQTFGDKKDSAILLIMGASASMIWWDDDFCKLLASKRRFVIRFDNRDVGRSQNFELWNPSYNVDDMVSDAIGILDLYNKEKAHLIGMSLGGMIAQLAAIKNPDRFLSLTLLASSIWDDVPTLPQIDKKIIHYQMQGQMIDWSDKETTIEFMVNGWKLLNGSRHPFDSLQAVGLAGREYDRARNLQNMFNHALLRGGEQYYGKSSEIKIPTLIIHGTEDPVLPFEHAVYTANKIPLSKLFKLEGAGHEIHKNDWDLIIKTIVEFQRSSN
jgi:pimeloyl-ACP methyl ester carboxylesterase